MTSSRAGSPQALLQRTFPSPLDSNEDASTVVSSRLSDADYGDKTATGANMDAGDINISRARGGVHGVTGPAGEAGLPPSRPVNVPTVLFNRRVPHESVDSFAGSTTSFRPGTSSTTTHIPSVTSSAFFNPMSSQRLQAYRGQRPGSPPGNRIRISDELEDTRSDTNRNSSGSAMTIRGGHALPAHSPSQYDIDSMPSISRGTEYSQWSNSERINSYMEPLGKGFTRRRSENIEPIPPVPVLPAHLEQGKRAWNPSPILQPPLRPSRSPPKSFVSGFRRPSKPGSAISGPNGHEKLSSRDTSLSAGQRKKEELRNNIGSNWEYFSGNTVFCWGGRLQTARDKPISIITGILVVLPSALFFAFPAPWLWHYVSPAIPIIFAYIFYVCISSYLHASLSNPGILPRNLHPLPPTDPDDDPLTVGPPTTEWTMVLSAVAQHGAFEVPTKYCKSCNIWRPPRCHHCRICDNCVDTQDHHCMWLNNCVGRRNYRYFFTFVASETLLGIFLFGACLGQVIAYKHSHRISMNEAMNRNRVTFALFIYGLIGFMYPAALWGYHVFLIARGQTTREYLNSNKFLKKDRHRPFNQNTWWKNWVVVLMRPRPPTYLNFKGKYEEGDQRFGERKGHRTMPLAQKQKAGGVEMHHFTHSVPAFQRPASGISREPIDRTPRPEFDQLSRA